jgi:hypothetical protein
VSPLYRAVAEVARRRRITRCSRRRALVTVHEQASAKPGASELGRYARVRRGIREPPDGMLDCGVDLNRRVERWACP